MKGRKEGGRKKRRLKNETGREVKGKGRKIVTEGRRRRKK